MRDQNFKKNPHTARFLMAFHTAGGTAATEPSGEDEAVAFVTGTPAPHSVRSDAQAGAGTVMISGYPVKVGGAYVTEKQAKWMIDIATTRVLPSGRTAEQVLVRLEQGFAKSAGSAFITQYKDLPRATAAMAEAIAPGATDREIRETPAERPAVEDGRYAVEHEGVLKFFRVKNGRKPGFVFLDVQASDDLHSIRNPQVITEILTLIAKDAHGAMVRYGHELGVCGRCGRTLTDAASRAAGIGPICADK